MALIPGGQAPYTPTTTVLTLMTGYRERGFATPFTNEVLIRAGIPDSLVNRTLQALRLLDLIDDNGDPTARFSDLKGIRGEDEYKAALKDWLYEVYSDVLQYADPTKDPTSRISEAFRGYHPEGQRSRMVTLMLGLFEYAGLIEPGTNDGGPTRRGTPNKTRPAPRKSGGTSRAQVDRLLGTTPQVKPTGLPPELLGLLQSIPENREWTQKRRDAFVKTFTMVVDYAIEIVPETEGEQ